MLSLRIINIRDSEDGLIGLALHFAFCLLLFDVLWLFRQSNFIVKTRELGSIYRRLNLIKGHLLNLFVPLVT